MGGYSEHSNTGQRGLASRNFLLPHRGRRGRPCQNCELLPLHTALNPWQEPDAAGLPRWLFTPQPLDGRRGCFPGWAPPQAAVLLSLRGSTGRCCRFKLFPY